MATPNFDGSLVKESRIKERLMTIITEVECLELEHARLQEYVRSCGLSAASDFSVSVAAPMHPLVNVVASRHPSARELPQCPQEASDGQMAPTFTRTSTAEAGDSTDTALTRLAAGDSTDTALTHLATAGDHSHLVPNPEAAQDVRTPLSDSEGGIRSRTLSNNFNKGKIKRSHRSTVISGLRSAPSYERLAHEGNLRRFAAWLVSSAKFESVVTTIILANVVYMGWAANQQFKNLHEKESTTLRVIDAVFVFMFTIELVLRIITYGCGFFTHADWSWNVFDTVLVLQGLLDQVLYFTGLNDGGSQVSFLRFLRLGKLVKMLRVIRVMRSMREMRLILFSIMGSVKGMFWSVLLIVAVLYMFSLVFVLASIDTLQTGDIEPGSQVELDAMEYWSSVETGMLTLFMSTTGGKDWADVAVVIGDFGPVYYGCFCFYIAFYLCVLMNTITALFVETTFATANKDLQYTIASVMENKADYVAKLEVLFNQLDTNGDGLISDEIFCSKLDDPEMRAFAESLDIEISDAQAFFRILTEDGKKRVDLETFVESCIKMRGQALSVDLQDLINQFKNSQTVFHQEVAALKDASQKIERLVSSLSKKLESERILRLEAERMPRQISTSSEDNVGLARRDLSRQSLESAPRLLSLRATL